MKHSKKSGRGSILPHVEPSGALVHPLGLYIFPLYGYDVS